MANNSRYKDSLPFQASQNGLAPFRGLRPRDIGSATPVLEHTLTSGDRLDLLAQHYYHDPSKWWRLLDANPEILCAAELSNKDMVGTIVLIPAVQEPEWQT